MKKASSVLGLGFVLFSAVAGAQTCTPGPTGPINLNSANSFTGNTCNGSNIAGTLCGVASAPELDIFYSVTLAAGYTATALNLTNNTATYTPSMVLYTGACANGGPATGCTVSAFGTTGANVSLPLTGVAAGSYFLDVTTFPGNGAADCGSYGLAYTGTLPVQLNSFSVE